MIRRSVLAGVTILGMSAAGCALGPNYRRADVAIPPAYRGVTVPQAQSLADARWFELFAEPELNALIREALDNNLDLLAAVARVEEFRARAGLARALLRPTVQGVFNTSPTPKPDIDNGYRAGLVFNWELDFFGRLRRSSEAARADLLASVGGARAAMASLVSDVAQTWFTQRQLFSAEIDCAQSRRALLLGFVELYRALGGGWSDEQLRTLAISDRDHTIKPR